MGAIAAIVHFDGKPVDRGIFEPVVSEMETAGAGVPAIFQGDGAALLQWRSLDGRENIRQDGRAPVLETGSHVLIADARIHNRDELIAALEPLGPLDAPVDDPSLLLRAYLRWGKECPGRILGDWSFAVWNKRERSLFAARDHHGHSMVTYRWTPDCLVLASSLKSILAVPEIPRKVDLARIAGKLAWFPIDHTYTAFEGIRRLPAAHWMRADSRDAVIHRYWKMEDAPEVHFRSDDDYVDRFREIFSDAVRARIADSHRPGATLSGGLDSGSIVAVASRILAEKGNSLHAFTSVPARDTAGACPATHFGDEGPYAGATAAHLGNVHHHRVDCGETGPLQGVRRFLEMVPEPVMNAGNAFWLCEVLAKAKEQGVSTLLMGAGGNATISWHAPGYLYSLARQGRWADFRREARCRERLDGRLPGRTLLPALFRSLMHSRVPSFSGSERINLASHLRLSPLRLSFAERFVRMDQRPEGLFDREFLFLSSRHQRTIVMGSDRSIAGGGWRELSLRSGFDSADPTTDKRVIEFCLGIPDGQYVRNGQPRFLIRRAMRGILPDKVLMNRRRGRQSADLVARIRGERAEIQRTMESFRRHEAARQLLDLEKMNGVLRETGGPVTPPLLLRCESILMPGLMVGLFVTQYS